MDYARGYGVIGTKKESPKTTLGGSNQIRTGVDGFADRYLTTRTWNLERDSLRNCDAKLRLFCEACKFFVEKNQ